MAQVKCPTIKTADSASKGKTSLSSESQRLSVGTKENGIEKLSYINHGNKKQYSVMPSNTQGLELIVNRGMKVTVHPKYVSTKRKARPSENYIKINQTNQGQIYKI